MTPRRYQLRKEAVGIALHHPWIFRDHLSSAAGALHDGDLLRLFDGANRVVGYGLYEASGAIAIRMVRRGPAPPDAAWVRARLAAAVARRSELATRTDAIRLIHGESDGLPAVVVDRFADVLVVTSYSAGADAYARYAACALDRASPVVGPAHHVVLRPARLRHAPAEPARVLRGAPPPVVHITEGALRLAVDLATGQKTGSYLDLRGLRREIAAAPLAGARVLNLFAYSGTLGLAAEVAGATAIVQVDASERALAFAAAHHELAPAHHELVVADVFDWLPAYTAEPFDLVIVDPPAMTSKAGQVPQVLAGYRKLYRAAARLVRPGGTLVAACCTSRIERQVFHRTVGGALGAGFTLHHELPPEPDHPVGFPQADYLKIGWWTHAA
ncbi:MAG TPA: class I SAM-dependent methyltransferase [Kofleriaceae bacterium]|nr:class I SAM-dependent methyltransferase [Kofleriaceae bacterium]